MSPDDSICPTKLKLHDECEVGTGKMGCCDTDAGLFCDGNQCSGCSTFTQDQCLYDYNDFCVWNTDTNYCDSQGCLFKTSSEECAASKAQCTWKDMCLGKSFLCDGVLGDRCYPNISPCKNGAACQCATNCTPEV